MRKFKKILGIVTVLMLVLTMLPTSVFAAGSYTASASKTTLTVGNTASLTITAKSSAGKFTVSSSNPSVATVNKSSLWIDGSHENASSKVTIKAVAEGTTTITVTPVNVSDNEYNLLTNTKTIKITVKKATTTTTNKDNDKTTTTKSSDATLKSLSTGVTYIDFSKNTTKYTVNVDKDVTSLGLKAVANSSKAKVKITGDENFVVGNNTVKVVVTAENGATKTYTVTVVKSGTGNAPLLDLGVKGYNISPEFEQDNLVYSVNVIGATDVELDYVLADENSKVTIEGADNLQVGQNKVKVIVTEQDGTVTTYTVDVYVSPETVTVDDNNIIWLIIILILVLLIVAETIYIIVKKKQENKEENKVEEKVENNKATKKTTKKTENKK